MTRTVDDVPLSEVTFITETHWLRAEIFLLRAERDALLARAKEEAPRPKAEGL